APGRQADSRATSTDQRGWAEVDPATPEPAVQSAIGAASALPPAEPGRPYDPDAISSAPPEELPAATDWTDTTPRDAHEAEVLHWARSDLRARQAAPGRRQPARQLTDAEILAQYRSLPELPAGARRLARDAALETVAALVGEPTRGGLRGGGAMWSAMASQSTPTRDIELTPIPEAPDSPPAPPDVPAPLPTEQQAAPPPSPLAPPPAPPPVPSPVPPSSAVPARVAVHQRLSASDPVVGLNASTEANEPFSWIRDQLAEPMGQTWADVETQIRDFVKTSTLRSRLSGMTRGDKQELEISRKGWKGTITLRAAVRDFQRVDAKEKTEFESGAEGQGMSGDLHNSGGSLFVGVQGRAQKNAFRWFGTLGG
nr:hypothetical protein [Micromonospora sp. DSM 115978]